MTKYCIYCIYIQSIPTSFHSCYIYIIRKKTKNVIIGGKNSDFLGKMKKKVIFFEPHFLCPHKIDFVELYEVPLCASLRYL